MFWQTYVMYEFGPFRVDTRERQLLRGGKVVPLTPKVFDVLLVLVQHSGHILSKDELMKFVWPDTAVEEGNVARNVSTLRTALGERPREQQYIETIPWRGYRFVEGVKEVRDGPIPQTFDSIAVLPFTSLDGDPHLEFLSDGITESLINSLSQLTRLKVTSRNSAFRYKDREVNAPAVGRALNVQGVILGRISKRDELISISVELVDARDDSHVWGVQHVRHYADIFTMPAKIGKEITEKLRLQLTSEEQRRLTRRHTESGEAYQLYLKGRYYFNKLTLDGVQKGLGHFQQAIEKDPHYALAYAGLGDCHNYLSNRERAKESVSKALELDEELGEAHASSGFFKFLYEWDFAGAESEFLRALALNPNYAEAHHWYAIYLANLGRHDEAFKEAELAVERDPLSLLMNMTAALNFYLAREYDRAIVQLHRVIEMEPNFVAARSVLGCVYVQKQMYKEAISEYQKVIDLSNGAPVIETSMKLIRAQAYARWGKKSKALKLLEEAARAGPTSSYSVAGVHAALGENDKAFALLNQAFEQHDLQLVSLKVDPTLDGLRDDVRFGELVRRVGCSTEPSRFPRPVGA
jgi:DNA-binding winged helix-turn-helix (wHTH) protein/tetratricopeptide (TPR) repeat protein